MGDRYPADKYGISSASLCGVYGCWLYRLFVWSVAARRQLVGRAREAGAPSAMWGHYSGSNSYVFARGLGSIVGLRALSNFCSAVAPDLNGRGYRLVCQTHPNIESRHCDSLGRHGLSFVMLDALHPWAVCDQKAIAVFPSGKVSACTNAEKRCYCRGLGHRVHTEAVLRPT
jgi:hypothetical protein